MADHRCKRKCPYQSNGWCIVSSGDNDYFARWRICSIALRKEDKVRRIKGRGKGWAQQILEVLALYPQGLTSTEMAAILLTSTPIVRLYMNNLEKQGVIHKRQIKTAGKVGYPLNLYFLTENSDEKRTEI